MGGCDNQAAKAVYDLRNIHDVCIYVHAMCMHVHVRVESAETRGSCDTLLLTHRLTHSLQLLTLTHSVTRSNTHFCCLYSYCTPPGARGVGVPAPPHICPLSTTRGWLGLP